MQEERESRKAAPAIKPRADDRDASNQRTPTAENQAPGDPAADADPGTGPAAGDTPADTAMKQQHKTGAGR